MKLIQFLIVIIFILFVNKTNFAQQTKITFLPETTFQTIHIFGASDAWSCQFVGNWPDEKRNHFADLLFSLDKNNDGSPKGIGLSCCRFNIGAGSADQNGDKKKLMTAGAKPKVFFRKMEVTTGKNQVVSVGF